MQSSLTRRRFAQACGLSMAGIAVSPARVLAVEPFQRAGSPRLLLSLAAYSFRDYFKDTSHKREIEITPNHQIDLFQFADYCADHGCAGTELTSYYFPKALDEAYLLRLRRHAFLRGVAVSGTAVGNTFTHP